MIVAATTIRAVVEYRPIARLASVGGRVDFTSRVVSFPDGQLSDAQLPFVVECLNETDGWFHLSLVRTKVTGAGLGHLRAVHTDYCLIVPDDALDESGLRHLSGFKNVQELWVVGTASPETRDQVQRALPGLPGIAWMEGGDL